MKIQIPHKVITDPCNPDRGPMLIRYFLLRTRWGNLYLHHFLRSDSDRHFHDHPWDFTSFLLGGYIEHTPAGTFRRRRFSILHRPAEWKHWVEVPKPVWTLILVRRRRRQWGFWTERGWVQHRAYEEAGCE